MVVEETEGAVRTGKDRFRYHNAECFQIAIPEKLGPAQAIYYDVKALMVFCDYIKKEKIKDFVVYIMACRIGPFMKYFYKNHKKPDLCLVFCGWGTDENLYSPLLKDFDYLCGQKLPTT